MIFLDVHESEELEVLLAARIQVVRAPLNERDIADIFWLGLDGTHQIEMKATGEILDNIEHVEGQLVRQFYSAKHSALMVRDVVSIHHDYSARGYSKRGKFFVHTYSHRSSYHSFRSWLNALDHVGVRVIEVPTMQDAVVAIMCEYDYSMRTDHSTFKKYYREKIRIPEKNPQILALMYLSLAYNWNIGYEKSAMLIGALGTLNGVLNADSKTLCAVKGIGPIIAKKIMLNPGGQGIVSKSKLPEV
ncbi:hypothetical protein LCGC14_1467950 [marine sediment metagenome]|uniref:ERCC4 domain-containing protein n=1 Tax=marine sediment metagenome TaxID=412755 RepID=A0A0F9LTM3_9ZZZZ